MANSWIRSNKTKLSHMRLFALKQSVLIVLFGVLMATSQSTGLCVREVGGFTSGSYWFILAQVYCLSFKPNCSSLNAPLIIIVICTAHLKPCRLLHHILLFGWLKTIKYIHTHSCISSTWPSLKLHDRFDLQPPKTFYLFNWKDWVPVNWKFKGLLGICLELEKCLGTVDDL